MKSLVVYYSRTGTSRIVAERIAAALGADLEVIEDRTRRTGALGWLRCGYEGYRGRIVDIGPSAHHPASYDLVVIGGPIWSRSVSSPVRSYLRRHRGALPPVAFFYTCGGAGNEAAFTQMTDECRRQPVATLAVRENEIANAPATAEHFARDIDRIVSDRPGAVTDDARTEEVPPRFL